MAKSLSWTTGYETPSSFVAATTLSKGFSHENSGECTPTIVRPAFSNFACQSRNCGITFLQLYQPYVQNSTYTTRPRSLSIDKGSLLIQGPPAMSGAASPTRSGRSALADKPTPSVPVRRPSASATTTVFFHIRPTSHGHIGIRAW